MRKNKLRVIQISGIRGLLSAAFIVICLAAGFVGFPALALSKLWNHFAETSGIVPTINLFQGAILWAILAISYLILNKKQRYLVAFEPKTNARDIKDIISEIKAQSAEYKQEPHLEPHEIKVQSPAKDSEKEEENLKR